MVFVVLDSQFDGQVKSKMRLIKDRLVIWL